MSYITDVLLCIGGTEEENNILGFNHMLQSEYDATLKKIEVDTKARSMDSEIYAAPVNYMDTDAVIEFFNRVAWKEPGKIQLMLKCEDWDSFAVYSPKLGLTNGLSHTTIAPESVVVVKYHQAVVQQARSAQLASWLEMLHRMIDGPIKVFVCPDNYEISSVSESCMREMGWGKIAK